MTKILLVTLIAFSLFAGIFAQNNVDSPKQVSFSTDDGGTIYGLEYGKGTRGVVLAHGGRFNKESWSKQADTLVRSGFRVIAIDFRGYAKSTGPGQDDLFTAPLHLDVLAGVRYLHNSGAKSVSVVGGSLGGGAGADAVTVMKPGEIARLVTLGGLMGNLRPEKINVPLLVITTRNDANAAGPRLPNIQAAFDKVPGKRKKLVILEGSAHAQFMFDTDQSEKIMKMIVKFLKKKK